MVNEFGEGIAALLATPETRQIAQLKITIPQIYLGKGPHEIVK